MPQRYGLGAWSRLSACASSLIACASASTAPPAGAPLPGTSALECSLRLPPALPADAGPPLVARPRPPSTSRLIAHVQVPLARVARELEARVQQRVAEGSANLGLGGRVTYRAERGPLSLSVTRAALVVETPIHAHAEACRGGSCYASCDPEGVARAEVPLLLDDQYRFPPSSVALKLTRGCKVRALGGLLSVDVTPTLQARLEPELARAARQIDSEMPSLRRELQRAWAELATPRALPLLGCLVTAPHGLVQGPFEPSRESLHGRFAVLATPELRSTCPTDGTPPALPRLERDLALPEADTLELAMLAPLSELERELRAASASVQGHSLHITGAELSPLGSDVLAHLELGGAVCGTTTLAARPSFDGAGQFVGLTHARFSPRERARLRGAELESAALGTALLAQARLPPRLVPGTLSEAVPAVVAALSPPELEVKARISSVRAAGASTRGTDLVAWVQATGSVLLELAPERRR